MKEREVRRLALHGLFENNKLRGKVEETHISWVILTRKYAFKIKKPLKLTFLDFSTLYLRKAYCEREILLNGRFSNIYLSVQPIRCVNDQWVIGGNGPDVVDYCVVMKRMALAKRMDRQLRAGKVTEAKMRHLAMEIASFHDHAKKVFTSFDLSKAFDTFNEIDMIREFITKKAWLELGTIIKRSIGWSNRVLEKYEERLEQRIHHGLKRDVHGDLHSGNIFLYRHPVLFDCIEFNDQYRQIDVLYEVAFLCMDLEAFRQQHLAQTFLAEYEKHFPAFQQPADRDLFIYFKCLRANIRAKVHAMSAYQGETADEISYHVSETAKYLELMKVYMADLSW